MNKIVKDKYHETYYTQTLDNGLKVVIYHKPEFKTSAACFGTPFGALNLYQSIDGIKHQFHSGLAHFLEHKLFETDDRDIMLDFNALGANVNAFTSYDCTVYYFTTAADEILKPLHLLLDFVQNFNVTDESVEKEKGIIVQELMMYQQMADIRLIFELFKAMYHRSPLKYDIGGSVDDVNAITKDELELSYQLNYHPNAMSLVIVSPVDPQLLMNEIISNQNAKKFANYQRVETDYYEDQQKVVSEKVVVNMPINNRKVALGFKFDNPEAIKSKVLKKEWALLLLFEMHFSNLNEDYQKWLDDKIINSYFSSEIDFGKGYAHLIFANETDDADAFKQFIIDQIAKIRDLKIDEEKLSQLKKRFYGIAYRVFDDPENLAISHLKNMFSDTDYYEMVEMILDIDSKFIKQCFDELDFSNNSLVIIESN